MHQIQYLYILLYLLSIQISTIIHYFLDKLIFYEEKFTDILIVDHISSCYEIFIKDMQSSDISNNIITQHNFPAFQANLIINLQSLLTPQRRLPTIFHGDNLALTMFESTFNFNISSVSTSNSLHL